MKDPVPLLVSTEWLAARLDDPGVRVADVRWSLKEKGKGMASYEEGHVPGAVFLDVDQDLAAPPGQGPGRHPLPALEHFASVMSRAGIGSATYVVACDFGDGSTAARLWWLLRAAGHVRVSLLDGGMARWNAEGRPLERSAPSPPPATFVARPRAGLSVDAAAVERLRGDPAALILDVRAAERYEGKVEPIDPKAGHIPGARNLPFAGNVRGADDPRFLEPAALRERFARIGADRASTVVCHCGSGVNACQMVFALMLAGLDGALLYEGSWSDWCSDDRRPVKVGPEP